jgi:hypothetical protein
LRDQKARHVVLAAGQAQDLRLQVQQAARLEPAAPEPPRRQQEVEVRRVLLQEGHTPGGGGQKAAVVGKAGAQQG